jgi:hypothetical protein
MDVSLRGIPKQIRFIREEFEEIWKDNRGVHSIWYVEIAHRLIPDEANGILEVSPDYFNVLDSGIAHKGSEPRLLEYIDSIIVPLNVRTDNEETK